MFASSLAALFVSLWMLKTGEDSTEQVFATGTFPEDRGRLAPASSLFLGMDLLASPGCILVVHACMYNTKPLLQQLFLKMITVETEEKGNLLDHLEPEGM